MELNKLKELLKDAGIDSDSKNLFGRDDCIKVVNGGGKSFSCVSHKYSYGGEKGLIEIQCEAFSAIFNDSCRGYFTAEQAFKIITTIDQFDEQIEAFLKAKKEYSVIVENMEEALVERFKEHIGLK